MERLALLGGLGKVTIAYPHFCWPEVYEEEIKAVEDYMRNGKIGKRGVPEIVDELERSFKKYHNLDFALALNSGTSCLHAAYYALGVGPGDEVIVPTFTFPATATPLFPLGAIPILCDCRRDTATIDVYDIARKITDKTKAIAITHLWGHPCEMDEIMTLATENNIPVLEDCSHAHGAKYKGRLVGTFGAVSCFSCDNQKLMASGEAGIMLTNSRAIFEKCIIFSDFGARVKHQLTMPEFGRFKETGFGLKYRVHPLAAVIANEKLKRLDRMNHDRVSTLDYFSRRLKETKSLMPPVTKEYVERGGYYGYKPIYKSGALGNLKIEDFVKILQAEGVDIRQTVTPPLHRTELFADSKNYGLATNTTYKFRKIKYVPEDFPNSEWFFRNHVSFPTFSRLKDRKIIDQYIEAIHKVEGVIKGIPGIIQKIINVTSKGS